VNLRRPLPLLLALALLPACGPEARPATMPPDAFVEVNVALRTIPDTVTDRDSARAAVLEAYGVEEDDLLAFLAAHERDLELLATTWREITTRVDSLAAPAEEILPDPESGLVPYDEHPEAYEEPALPHREPPGYRPPRVRTEERTERLPPPPAIRPGGPPLPRGGEAPPPKPPPAEPTPVVPDTVGGGAG
jgi:hypothetical protein